MKQEHQKADEYLHIRVQATVKARWVEAAKRENVKLSRWVKDHLTLAAAE